MNKIISFLIVGVVAGIVPNAFGYGLGDAESSTVEIEDNKLKIKTIITPEIIEEENPQFELNIELLDSDSQKSFSDVGYNLKILDSADIVIFEDDIFTSDKTLVLDFNPEETKDFQISGDKNDKGFWIASEDSSLQISGPIFLDGGIYKIQTTVKILQDQEIKIPNTFETILIIGEIIPFQITDNEKKYDLEFISYFDKIENISFDEELNSVKAEMKFNWAEDFIEPIPFVHSEVYLPSSWEKFTTHEINTFVNEIQVFGLVDKSQQDQTIIHFLVNNKQLKTLSSQINESDKGKFIFEVRAGESIGPISNTSEDNDVTEDAIVKLSSQSDWKVYFWWEPLGEILPYNETTFNIMFHDPDTNIMQKNVTYDLFVYQNNELINSKINSQSQSGHVLQDLSFENNGNVQVVIKNINSVDTDVKFEFYVGDETQKINIPKWVKNNAQWWAEKKIDDSTFASGIEFMIKEQIIQVPETEKQQDKDNDTTIPDWVRNNASWWSSDQISDKEFASGLQFLVQSGIITV